jgi:hypothetical protein
MAFLSKEERDALAEEIKDKNFGQIRGYVHGKDAKARLAYFRNVQESGKWMTRYVLETFGTMVTVYEDMKAEKKGWFSKQKYVIDKIVVEPTKTNRN